MVLNKRVLAIAGGSAMVLACIFFIASNALPSWSSADRSLEGLDQAQLASIYNSLAESGLTADQDTKLTSLKATVGLWRSCVSAFGKKMCGVAASSCSLTTGEVASMCHKMMAARAFVTMACIISGVSAICLFACAIETINQNKMAIMISKALASGSFVMGVIGLAVGIAFITNLDSFVDVKMSVSVAAILAIVAVVMNLLGAVLAIMIR